MKLDDTHGLTPWNNIIKSDYSKLPIQHLSFFKSSQLPRNISISDLTTQELSDPGTIRAKPSKKSESLKLIERQKSPPSKFRLAMKRIDISNIAGAVSAQLGEIKNKNKEIHTELLNYMLLNVIYHKLKQQLSV